MRTATARQDCATSSAPVGILMTTVLVMVGCAANAPAPGDQTPGGESLDTLRAVVLQLVGDPVCDDVSQCRSMAFGAKPCGGPWSYLVYSVQTADSTRLATAVTRYNDREAQLNRELGRASDCQVVTPPRLSCVNSRCAALPD